MSTENYQNTQILSFLTNSAVVKRLAAKLAAGREIDEASVAGAWSPGIIMDTETSTGIDVGVLAGPAFVLATSGAAFSDLDPLMTDAAGKYITATANGTVLAYAMEAAGGADEDKLIFLLPPSQYKVAGTNIADLSAITGGESPTEAEHNLVVSKVNAILTALEAQGILASS
jgi:hypothetical protein